MANQLDFSHGSVKGFRRSPLQKINHEYRLWEWNFPKPLADETEKELKKKRIQQQMDELQKKLNEMEKE